MPNGAPEMPFRLSDAAMLRISCAICECDIWPNFARSHDTIAGPLLALQGPPGLVGPGAGPGLGAGAAGPRKTWVADHSLTVSPRLSLARTRQKWVTAF